ncbi:MAG: hypothetical protein ACOCUJ_01525 [Thiohalospira sp.]
MDFLDLEPEIAPEVGGAPSPVVERAVREVARDFCRRTQLWRDEQPPTKTRAERADVYLAIPPEAAVSAILRATVGGRELQPETSRRSHPGQQPTHYWLEQGQILRLTPTPQEGGESLEVILALIPSSTAASLPDWIADEAREALVYGALSRLLVQRTSWGDPEMAQMYRQQYEQEVARHRVAMSRGHSNASTHVQTRPFI